MNEGLKVPKKEGEIKVKEDKQDQIILNQIKTKMIMWYEKVKKEKEQFRAEKVILSKQKESFQTEIQEEKENLAKQEELLQAKINKFKAEYEDFQKKKKELLEKYPHLVNEMNVEKDEDIEDEKEGKEQQKREEG